MKENVISRMLRDVARRAHMRPRGIPLAMTMKHDGHAFMSMESPPADLTASGSSAITHLLLKSVLWVK